MIDTLSEQGVLINASATVTNVRFLLISNSHTHSHSHTKPARREYIHNRNHSWHDTCHCNNSTGIWFSSSIDWKSCRYIDLCEPFERSQQFEELIVGQLAVMCCHHTDGEQLEVENAYNRVIWTYDWVHRQPPLRLLPEIIGTGNMLVKSRSIRVHFWKHEESVSFVEISSHMLIHTDAIWSCARQNKSRTAHQ